MVEFISYSGKYPALCHGILKLKIDGETVTFGHDYLRNYFDKEENPPFWTSGGECYINLGDNDELDASVTTGEWEIDKEVLPKKYQKYAEEIKRVFNENVDYGCCGGCI